MKKWTMWMMMLVVVTMLAFPAVTLAAGGPPAERGSVGQQGVPVAGDPLTAEQEVALVEFWMDEHKALATYQAVMAQFGEVQPFASIAQAELSHIAAIERIFARYGVAVPAVPTFDVPAFESVEAACAAAAQAEIDNAALYDALLSGFTQADILQVAGNLRDASLNNHLPAFEACAEGTYVAGAGTVGSGYQGGAMNGAKTPGTGLGTGYGATNAPRLNAQYPDCPNF